MVESVVARQVTRFSDFYLLIIFFLTNKKGHDACDALCSSMYSEVVSEAAFVSKLWFGGHCSAVSTVCVTGFGCRTL